MLGRGVRGQYPLRADHYPFSAEFCRASPTGGSRRGCARVARKSDAVAATRASHLSRTIVVSGFATAAQSIAASRARQRLHEESRMTWWAQLL
ncbi:hypothetical protein C4K18_3975 [Pseudomonas chlororaphis subsp. aurantiaca]|nr:hypothetical protein C4K18_3975 [Pseudomonas chlororaphis subsp. aurantiaca]